MLWEGRREEGQEGKKAKKGACEVVKTFRTRSN